MRKPASLFIASALLFSTAAAAATPSEGVPLQVRRGFFTETDIGGFWTLGGANADKPYSNLQSYLQLGVGYQLTINDGKGLIPIGVQIGIGANSQNCWANYDKARDRCGNADNFTMTFITASGGYLHQVLERFFIGGKIIAGVTLLDPEPVTGVTFGANVGGALSLEYATNMDHFSVGLDISVRFVIGPNIPAFAVYPRVQYTF